MIAGCEKIDILINNAAVMAIPNRTITTNGFEMQMGVNHFGHFYLTSLLWNKIRKAIKPRIINVSSNAHAGFGIIKHNLTIDFEDINLLKGYTPALAYGRSKAANILFTKQLQKQMDEAKIDGLSVSLHPGVVRTELARYFNFGFKVLFAITYPFRLILMKSPWEGAQTTLYTVL